MFSYINPKDPQILFDGSYFFHYICNMNIIQIVGLVLLILCLWIVYEIWRAPLVKEDSNGGWIEIEPTKKISDLFKKRKK